MIPTRRRVILGSSAKTSFDPSSLPSPDALWMMNEGSGSLVKNSFATAHNTTNLLAAPEQVLDQVFLFDGTNIGITSPFRLPSNDGAASFTAASSQSFSITSNATLQNTADLTIVAWVKLTTIGSFQPIVSKGVGGTTSVEYALYVNTDNTVHFDIGDNVHSPATVATAAIGANSWCFIVAQYNSTTKTAFISANTLPTITVSSITPTATSVPNGTYSGTNALMLGSDGTHFLNGNLDSVAIFKRFLTASELDDLFNLGSTGTASISYVGMGRRYVDLTTINTKGAARFLSASSQYLSKSSYTSLNAKSAFTIAGWFRRNGSNPDSAVVSQITDANNGIIVGFDGSTNARFTVSNGSAAFGFISLSDVSNFHHIVAIYDGSQVGNAARAVLYIDGVQQTLSFTGTIPATTATFATPLEIGRQNTAGTIVYSNGSIDSVGIWTKALTSQEAISLYNSAAGVNFSNLSSSIKTNLSAWYDFTNDTNFLVDASGNSNNLTNNGGVSYALGQAVDGSINETSNVAVWYDFETTATLTADSTTNANTLTNNNAVPATVGPVYWSSLANPISGDPTVTRLQFTAGARTSFYTNGTSIANGTQITISMYAKTVDGATKTLRFFHNDNNQSTNFSPNVTGSWQQISATITVAGTLTSFGISNDGTNAADVHIYGLQIESGPTAHAYVPYQMDGVIPLGSTISWTPRGLSNLTSPTNVLSNIPCIRSSPKKNYGAMTMYIAFSQSSTSTNGVFVQHLRTPNSQLQVGTGNGTIHNLFANGMTSGWDQHLASLGDDKWHILTVVVQDDSAVANNSATVQVYLDGYLSALNHDSMLKYTNRGFDLFGALVTTGGNKCQLGMIAVYSQTHTGAQMASMVSYMRTTMNARGAAVVYNPNIVCYEGDSITAGTLNIPYASLLHNVMPDGVQDSLIGLSGSVVGTATPVTKVTVYANARAPFVDTIIATNPTQSVITVFLGANDLNGTDANTFFTQIQSYVAARRAAGWKKIFVSTVLPRTAVGFNTVRNAYNTLLYTDWNNGTGPNTMGMDGLIDPASDPLLGPDAAASNTTYYVDGTHPTVIGQNILGKYFLRAISQTFSVQLLNVDSLNITDKDGTSVIIP